MLDRLLILTMRIFMASLAVNMLLPDGSLTKRVIATLAIALIPSIK
jgi:hypothetical protein